MDVRHCSSKQHLGQLSIVYGLQTLFFLWQRLSSDAANAMADVSKVKRAAKRMAVMQRAR